MSDPNSPPPPSGTTSALSYKPYVSKRRTATTGSNANSHFISKPSYPPTVSPASIEESTSRSPTSPNNPISPGFTPHLNPFKPQAGVKDLPLELLEEIASYLPTKPYDPKEDPDLKTATGSSNSNEKGAVGQQRREGNPNNDDDGNAGQERGNVEERPVTNDGILTTASASNPQPSSSLPAVPSSATPSAPLSTRITSYFAPRTNPLLAFSQSCRQFRLASLMFLPHLNRNLVFGSLADLERLMERDSGDGGKDKEDKSKESGGSSGTGNVLGSTGSLISQSHLGRGSTTRKRLRYIVRHITLDAQVPPYWSRERVRKALLPICVCPALDRAPREDRGEREFLEEERKKTEGEKGRTWREADEEVSEKKSFTFELDQPSPSSTYRSQSPLIFPNLLGVTFSSRFITSFLSSDRLHKDWSGEIQTRYGITGWKAKVLGGLGTVGTVLSGGQALGERWGDAEVLFLKEDDEERTPKETTEKDENRNDGWTDEMERRFEQHFLPPFIPPSFPHLPFRLLITPFPPSSPPPPSPLSPIAFQASHQLFSSLVPTARRPPSTPIRPFLSFRERTSREATRLLREWDLERDRKGVLGNPFWDSARTPLMAGVIVERLCLSVPEPGVIDALMGLELDD